MVHYLCICVVFQTAYDVVLLGGLSGRLDQTIHTLSFLHKLRKSGRRLFAVTDENVGWVLDEVGGFFFYFYFYFSISSSDFFMPHTLWA
jgi:thiamine pyrophosphokinase